MEQLVSLLSPRVRPRNHSYFNTMQKLRKFPMRKSSANADIIFEQFSLMKMPKNTKKIKYFFKISSHDFLLFLLHFYSKLKILTAAHLYFYSLSDFWIKGY